MARRKKEKAKYECPACYDVMDADEVALQVAGTELKLARALLELCLNADYSYDGGRFTPISDSAHEYNDYLRTLGKGLK